MVNNFTTKSDEIKTYKRRRSRIRRNENRLKSFKPLLLMTLLLSLLIPIDLTQAQVSCPDGYYRQTDGNGLQYCTICPAGSRCSSNNITPCSSGEYSTVGSNSCTTCVAGYECTSTSSFPTSCTTGEKSSSGATSCTTCSNQDCEDPFSPQTCASSEIYNSGLSCEACPAGYSCSSGAATACASDEYSDSGNTVCSSITANQQLTGTTSASVESCPENTFKYTTTDATCHHCAAGKSCNSSTETNCVAGTSQSGAGDYQCQTVTSYYGLVIDGTGTTAITFQACPAGEYNNAGTCEQCPVGYECDTLTTKVACGTGYNSPAGQMYCYHDDAVAPFQAALDGAASCNSNQYWDGSACVGCGNLSVCVGGNAGTCQAGEYIKTTTSGGVTTTSCETCTAGYWCPDGVYRHQNTNTYQNISPAGSTLPIKCPAGYKCTSRAITGALTKCPNDQYSPYASSTCTEEDYIYAEDLGGADCPNNAYDTSSTSFYCAITTLDQEVNGATAQQTCTADNKSAWFGKTCETCQGESSDWASDCQARDFFNTLFCDPGKSIWNKDGSSNYSCRIRSDVGSKEFIEGQMQTCWSGIDTSNEGRQCGECADLHYCSGWSDPSVYSTQEYWPQSGYCWGQKEVQTFYDDFAGLKMYDRRLHRRNKSACQDCNRYEIRDSICTFTTGYFSDHDGDNLVCPWQTKTTQIERYDFPDSTLGAWHEYIVQNDADVQDYRDVDGFQYNRRFPYTNPGVWSADGSNLNYTSYLSWVTPDSTYEYPYCGKDTQYYTQFVLQDSRLTYDEGNMCSLYEYLTPNYPRCQTNLQGHISQHTSNTNQVQMPTMTRVNSNGDGFFLKMENDGDYGTTALTLSRCPQHSVMLNGYTGAGFTEQACVLRDAGDCRFDSSDFCNNGGEFQCPQGYYLANSPGKSVNDCSPCPSGQYCGSGSSTTACPTGYQCLAYTYDEFSHPANPGDIISDGSTITEALNTGYAPGATGTTTTCPSGHSIPGSDTGHHSAAGCVPDAAGGGGTAGEYAPMGMGGNTETSMSCPPGTSTASTTAMTVDDCTDCAAGGFCAAGSSALGNCPSNHYCPARTIFNKWFPCPSGTKSSVGTTLTTDASCTGCSAGAYCREGMGENTALCTLESYVCPAGSSERVACDAGTYVASGTTPADAASCTACVAGAFCEGIGTANCPAGTFSGASASECTPVTAGTYSATDGTQNAGTNSAANMWSLEGDIEERDCQEGYVCDGAGTKSACPKGSYCPAGAAAVSNTGAGKIQDEQGLWFDAACPAGKVCPAATEASSDVSIGYWTIAGEGTDSTNVCATGYFCPSGSIGPYSEVCAPGSWSTDATGCQAIKCVDGQVCFQGESNNCPQGFFCEQATDPWYPEACPLGTYLDGSGTSFPGVASTSCTNCDAGYACMMQGTHKTSSTCGAGYFCNTNAVTTTPNVECAEPCTDTGGYLCPVGKYCTEGTTEPQFCPSGTFSNSFGLRSADECIDCIEGYQCPGIDQARSECEAGYYCPIKTVTQETTTADDSSGMADAGYFTEAKYPNQVKCLPGYFSEAFTTPGTSPTTCTPCTVGSYCATAGVSTPTTCTAGYDCSNSGTVYPYVCRHGTYNTDPANACADADEDKYVNQYAGSSTQICASGFKCLVGATVAKPSIIWVDDATTPNYICKEGMYCDASASPVENDCPIGTYYHTYGATSLADCQACDEGFKCIDPQTVTPTTCAEGYYCPLSTATETCGGTDVCETACSAGYHCPLIYKEDGVTEWYGARNQYSCGFGLEQPDAAQATCDPCTAGYYCSTTVVSTHTICDTGYYCPTYDDLTLTKTFGAATPIHCPQGLHTKDTGKALLSDCEIYGDVSYYIKYVDDIGVLSDGYKAGNLADYTDENVGEWDKIPIVKGSVCSQGSYCLAGIQTTCPAGKFCDSYFMSVDPNTGVSGSLYDCDFGYYCESGAKSRRPRAQIEDNTSNFNDICKRGEWCGAGVSGGTQCPAGFYSSGVGLREEAECIKCPPGYECEIAGLLFVDDSTTVAVEEHVYESRDCAATYYCPINTGATGITKLDCEKGKYCAGGNMNGMPCQPGYYAEASASICTECEPGSFCPYTTSVTDAAKTSQKEDCIAGHECEVEQLAQPKPCSPGYYQATANGANICAQCEEGTYCPTLGTITPLTCPDGFRCLYSELGHITPVLCEKGKLCNQADTGSQSVDTKCPTGYYCINGQKYVCFAGYICIEGSVSPTPTDGTTGIECPQGSYCDAGATQTGTEPPYTYTGVTGCPAGTYMPYTGAAKEADCIPCIGDQNCPDVGMIAYSTISCPATKYCDASGTEHDCEAGFYCPDGDVIKYRCPHGQFSAALAASCTDCDAGQYCLQPEPLDGGGAVTFIDYVAGVTDTVKDASNCPKGFYCDTGTAVYGQTSCPLGTYGAAEQLTTPNECTSCDEKYYCPMRGMTDADVSTYPCKDGYVCETGSQSETGTFSCPEGYFCAAGDQTICPDGTISFISGLESTDECIECYPGSICTTVGTTKVITDCPEGYYCPGNLKLDSEKSECTAGHYCPAGSYEMQKCQPGTYQDENGKSSCKICPAGSYCDVSGLTDHILCSTSFANWYCPEGSINPKLCEIGEYANNQIECLPCGLGEYCFPDDDGAGGLTTNGIKGDCDLALGFICIEGAYSEQPIYEGFEYIQSGSSTFNNYNGPAIRGYYVDVATKKMAACPSPTWNPSFFSGDITDCQDCYKGRYCDIDGMSDLSNNYCQDGYICNTRSDEAAPTDNVKGQPCEIGYMCPALVIHPLQCADGFRTTEIAQAACEPCKLGYYCDRTEDLIEQLECIPNSVCPAGTPRQPNCPNGLYKKELTDISGTVTGYSCEECPDRRYCRGGLEVDFCAAGYICLESKQRSPNPSTDECPEGHYCPRGVTFPYLCPYETMSVETAAIQITDCRGCQPGYLCKWGERKYYECPKGSYCPVDDERTMYREYEYKCPRGTYNPWPKKVWLEDCLQCTEGYYCDEEGTITVSKKCPLGHYCTEGTADPMPCPPGFFTNQLGTINESDCQSCPPGYFCPEGTAEPIRCSDGHYCTGENAMQITSDGGYYSNEETNFQMEDCPVNHYCPRGTGTPKPCDNKHTCNYGSEYPYYCAPGFQVIDNSIFAAVNTCEQCPPGTYSFYDTEGCKPCTKGFVCYGQTSTSKPTLVKQDNGELCPKGHFCPEGSAVPTKCPPGTYNPDFGGKSEQDCRLCAENTFQELFGQVGCKPCGQFATSQEGSALCTCIGKYRTYSAEDASCRCMSGYDFLNEDDFSLGNASDNTDCFPIVFDNCAIKGQGGNPIPRQPDGTCVSDNECESACNGEPGVRSLTVGVCTCSNSKNVDDICNQNCRDSSPKVGYKSSYEITISQTIDGRLVKSDLDLTQIGYLVAGMQPCETGNCNIKTVSIGSSGFAGTYGLPEKIEEAVAGRRRLQDEIHEDLKEHARRRLATLIETNINNPIYCIHQNDSFVFQIDSPNHYPIYMKNSVLNSNPNFDFGAFQTLETEVLSLRSKNQTDPIIFTFTFSDPGTYVFNDAANEQKIMIISVKGLGEQCADPDRYVQTVSEDSLSQIGANIKEDLIVEPNYPLIASLGFILIFSTAVIMLFLGYCLHKNWTMPQLVPKMYRDFQIDTVIEPDNDDLFNRTNDFINHKSDLIDSEEDDLDNFNLNIQTDLVNAGERYLRMFKKRKDQHKSGKRLRRYQIKSLITEIEDLIKQLGDSAIASNMHWLDLNADDDLDVTVLKEKIEKEQKAANDREREEEEAYNEKRDQMMKDASDRDRLAYNNALNMAKKGAEKHEKDLNAEGGNFSDAVYGEQNQRANKVREEILNNPNLTEDERRRMLKAQEENLDQIQQYMEADQKRQAQELDRVLKERLERRKKLKEKQHKKEIAAEIKAVEKALDAEFEQREKDLNELLAAETKDAIDYIMQNPDPNERARERKELAAEDDAKRKAALEVLHKEKQEKLEKEKDAIRQRFLAGAQTEAELRQELQELIHGDRNAFESAIKNADKEKDQQSKSMQDKLAERRRKREAELEKLRKDQEDEIANNDIERLAEQDSLAQQTMANAFKMLIDKKKKEMDASERNSLIGNAFKNLVDKKKSELENQADAAQTDPSKKNANLQTIEEIAKHQEEERKHKSGEQLRKIAQDIDFSLEKSSLLGKLADQDNILAQALEEDQERQRAKLEQRRALLLARRRNQNKQAVEEQRIKNKVEMIAEEEQEKQKISSDYIKNLFLSKNQPTDEHAKEKRLELLNEYLSDQFLERMSGLLMKQFTEKEQLLKLLLQKYMDQQAAECDNIKKSFKLDVEKLNELKDKMTPIQHRDAMQKLVLEEENLLREIELKLKQAHKEEESNLRSDLEKKHASEQLEFRNKIAQEQAQLRKELIGDNNLVNSEADADKKALEKYELQKKQEQERRLRGIELQKKTIQNTYEQELKNRYASFDEFKNRKREEQKELQKAEQEMRERIEAQKASLAEQNFTGDMTEEERKAELKKLEVLLEQIENDRLTEATRFQNNLHNRLAARKAQNTRNRRFKQQEQEKKKEEEKNQRSLQDGLAKMFNRRATLVLDEKNDNSELMKRLRSWKLAKKAHDEAKFQDQIAAAEVDLEENEVKILVLKLMQVERLLREIRKKRKTQLADQGAQTKVKRIGRSGSRIHSAKGSNSSQQRFNFE